MGVKISGAELIKYMKYADEVYKDLSVEKSVIFRVFLDALQGRLCGLFRAFARGLGATPLRPQILEFKKAKF